MELWHYLSIYLSIYLFKWPSPEQHSVPRGPWACPHPVSLLLHWEAASCLHYPPKCKMLPYFSLTKGQPSSYLEAWSHKLAECQGRSPPSSRIFQMLSQSQLMCLLLEPRLVCLDLTQRRSLLCPRVLFTPGLGCVPGKICLLGFASLGPTSSQWRWHSQV